MKVWILQTGEPLHCDGGNPRPMRAMNLADMLVGRGHSVVIWSSAFYHQEKVHRTTKFESLKINDLLTINLIPSVGYKKNIGLSRLIDHAQLAWNLSRILEKDIFTKPDVAFVGYPPIECSFVVAHYLTNKSIPFVLDVKDQWPDIFLEPFPKNLRPLIQLAFYPYFYLARLTFLKSFSYASMSQSFLNWMANFSGRTLTSMDRIFPLVAPQSEFSDEDLQNSIEWWKERIEQFSYIPIVSFVGSLSPAFDFQALKLVAERFQSEDIRCQFIICGEGSERIKLQNEMKSLNNVSFPGWIDLPQIISLYTNSIAVIAPYNNTANFIDNIPNKIIDTFSNRRPLLTSLEGEVRKLIIEHDVGFAYKDEYDLYDYIKKLITDPDYARQIGDNAYQLYLEKFEFNKVYGELVDHLELVALNKC